MRDSFDVTSLTATCEALKSISNLQNFASSKASSIGNLDFSKVPNVSGKDIGTCKSCLDGVCGKNGGTLNTNVAYNNLYNTVNLLYRSEAEASGLFGGQDLKNSKLDFAKYYLYSEKALYDGEFALDVQNNIAKGTLTENEAKMLQISLLININKLSKEIEKKYEYIEKHKGDPNIAELYNEILASKASQNMDQINYLTFYQFYDDFDSISLNRIADVRVLNHRGEYGETWVDIAGNIRYKHGWDGIEYFFYDKNGNPIPSNSLSMEEIQLYCARVKAAGGIAETQLTPEEMQAIQEQWKNSQGTNFGINPIDLAKVKPGGPITNEYIDTLQLFVDRHNGRKELDSDYWSHIDASALSIYNYLAHKPEYSNDKKMFVSVYQDSVNHAIAYEQYLEFVDYLEKHGPVGDFFNTTMQGFTDGTDRFTEGISAIIHGLSDTTSVLTYKQALIASYLMQNSYYLDDVYNISSAIGNMVPAIAGSLITSMFLGPVGGKIVGGALIGASAAGNAAQEAYLNGLNKQGAFLYGTLTGVSEASLGMFLGKIPGLSFTSSNILIDLLGEGIEESAQEVIGTLLLNKISGMNNSINIEEVYKAGIYGIITAGLLNGGSIVLSNNLSNNHVVSFDNCNSAAIESVKKSFSKISATDLKNPVVQQALTDYVDIVRDYPDFRINMDYFLQHLIAFGPDTLTLRGEYATTYGFYRNPDGTFDYAKKGILGCHTTNSFIRTYEATLRAQGFTVDFCKTEAEFYSKVGSISSKGKSDTSTCYYCLVPTGIDGVYQVKYSVPTKGGDGKLSKTMIFDSMPSDTEYNQRRSVKTVVDSSVISDNDFIRYSYEACLNVIPFGPGSYITHATNGLEYCVYIGDDGTVQNCYPTGVKIPTVNE